MKSRETQSGDVCLPVKPCQHKACSPLHYSAASQMFKKPQNGVDDVSRGKQMQLEDAWKSVCIFCADVALYLQKQGLVALSDPFQPERFTEWN